MKFRSLWKSLAVVSVLSLASFTASAGVTVAKIEALLIYSGGSIVYVYPVGGVASAPSCHGGNGNYYSFALSRPYAKEYLAALLAAQASGATVTFFGMGTCTEQTVSETLNYFIIASN
jgi:hypothetical protein